MDADAGAVVAGVGQRGQPGGRCVVERREGVAAGGGDVLEGAPAAGEQGEPAFAQAAQGTLDGVAGAGVNVEFLACLLYTSPSPRD